MRHIASRRRSLSKRVAAAAAEVFSYLSHVVFHFASAYFFVVFVLCKIIKDKILCYSLCWGLRHDD